MFRSRLQPIWDLTVSLQLKQGTNETPQLELSERDPMTNPEMIAEFRYYAGMSCEN